MPKNKQLRLFVARFLSHPKILAMGALLLIGLDVILFSNCFVPGDTQSPQILEKGKSDMGLSGNTFYLWFPWELGGYYRHGLGHGLDLGLRVYNSGLLWEIFGGRLENDYEGFGGVVDIRQSIADGNGILKMASGYSGTGLLYLAPSIISSFSSWGYMGLKFNSLIEPGQGDFVGGPSVLGGIRLGKTLYLSLGGEAGVLSPFSDEGLPLLQLEAGLGYHF